MREGGDAIFGPEPEEALGVVNVFFAAAGGVQ